jgi:hypothetical protein
MNADDLKEFLFSLAWSQWSCYHNGNVSELLAKNYPGVDFSQELIKFREIIASEPGPGSPK